jgi:GNAT superfamily N-acetyltransferase
MNPFLMRLVQAYEFIKLNGVISFVHEICYCNRVAIVVEKNLIEIDAPNEQPENFPVKMIELRPEILNESNFIYPVKNRYLKAVNYLKKGYGGYAIVKDERIIGDIWFVQPNDTTLSTCHSDCKLLRITCAKNQVYTFDMFLAPEARGSNLSFFLQSSALKALRHKGCTMAYGYYWGDNLPALWTHRLGKWKEINRLKVNRFLFFKKVFV